MTERKSFENYKGEGVKCNHRVFNDKNYYRIDEFTCVCRRCNMMLDIIPTGYKINPEGSTTYL